MKENNQISLSFEMYEDLKDTLVKAIKNTKAGGAGNAGLENAQLERIERLIEAAERSQGQVAQLLEHLQRHTAQPEIKTEQEREIVNKYDMLLQQLAERLEVIDKENRQTHTLIEQVGQAVEAAAMLKNLPVQEHRHTYTLDIKSSKTLLTMFVRSSNRRTRSRFSRTEHLVSGQYFRNIYSGCRYPVPIICRPV